MLIRMLLLSLALVLSACARAQGSASEGVSVYLPAKAMSGGDILQADLSQVQLQAQPIIASDEVLYYSASGHDLVVTRAAMDRLAALQVPVQGLGFVICDGSTPLLAGAFWTPLSSLSFDGLTINIPFGPSDTRLHLYSGYPMLDASVPNDPRDDPSLLDAFRRTGKLR